MKIKAFRIKNFMSWEEGYFDLSPNVTIFAGVSDKGKSAILKGFSWLKDNRPNGNEFASDWIKKQKKNGDFELIGECSFTAILDNDIEITRAKGPKLNEYRISTLEKPLEAIGTNVPEQVSSLLNMSDINIQEQANPNFLIGDSPPEIGRKLNQIASLSDIDIAFKNADSEIRGTNADIRKGEAELIRAELQLEKYDWLDNAEKDLLEIEKVSSELSIVRSDEQRLRNTYTNATRLQSEIDKHKHLAVDAKKDIQEVLALEKEIERLDLEIDDLTNTEYKIAELQGQIEAAKKIIVASKDIAALVSQKVEIEKLRIETDNLIDLEEKIQNAQDNVEKARQEYDKVHMAYEEIAPEECPLCGAEWEGK